MNRSKDITGLRFGRWEVLKRAKNNSGGTAMWLCRCLCGNQRTVRGTELRYGASQSCGCLNKEITRAVCVERNTTHGKSGTREHRIWKSMIQRCHNPNNPSYKDWGGRGIYVCKRWRDSFENFLSDMGQSQKDQSIDRINNNGPYKPSNCRWTSYVEQSSNTRKNRNLSHNGKIQTLSKWSRETGLRKMTIHRRLSRGWSVKDALEKPTNRETSITY